MALQPLFKCIFVLLVLMVGRAAPSSRLTPQACFPFVCWPPFIRNRTSIHSSSTCLMRLQGIIHSVSDFNIRRGARKRIGSTGSLVAQGLSTHRHTHAHTHSCTDGGQTCRPAQLYIPPLNFQEILKTTSVWKSHKRLSQGRPCEEDAE